jgi:hypothetical protein
MTRITITATEDPERCAIRALTRSRSQMLSARLVTRAGGFPGSGVWQVIKGRPLGDGADILGCVAVTVRGV